MKKFSVIIGTIIFTLSLFVCENRAATRTVNTLSDNFGVVNSLRYWINNSNAGDTIVFQDGLRGISRVITVLEDIQNADFTAEP